MKPYKARMGKKGSISDFPIMIMILLGVAIGFFVLHNVYTSIHDGISNTNVFEDFQTGEDILADSQEVNNGFDGLIVFILVMFAITLVVTAMFIPTHPVFFFVTLFAFLSLAVIGTIFRDFFGSITSSNAMANTTATFPMTVQIMNNLPLFIVVMLILSGVAFYAKMRWFSE